MVAIAATKPDLPEPEYSRAVLRECGGLNLIAKIMWQHKVAPRLIAEDYGDMPAEVAIANGRAIDAGHGVVFAAYQFFGTRAMTDITLHVVWTIGRSLVVCLAAETTEAG